MRFSQLAVRSLPLLAVAGALLSACGSSAPPPWSDDPGVPAGGFRFIAWGDTKDATDALAALSTQARPLDPTLTLFAGDVESAGFTTSGADAWRAALDGGTGNGIADITFAVSGNHDKGDKSGWQHYFDVAATVRRIGGSHLSQLEDQLTYSFDYGNAHFVAVDVPGEVTSMADAELQWVDADLSAAEQRGLEHAFLFWHGPIYPVAEHCCDAALPAFVDVANRHPSVSAVFHGHEHVYAWVHVDAQRYANTTHEFEEFITGDAGAGPDTCRPTRVDYCQDEDHGFIAVDVDGESFTVRFFDLGSSAPVEELDFTK